MEFKTINKNSVAEIEEKKSKFIAHLYYVESIEEAENYIKAIKKEYYDAKHNCFAYAIETGNEGILIKYNDDGEPSGTAGSPMLKVLLEQGLSNVLIIVTRYFGGTLLGTGGLVRAYSGVVVKALENIEYIEKQDGYELEVEVDYSELENFKYFCNKNLIKITNVEYKETIKINVEICKKMENEFTKTGNKRKIKVINHKIIGEKYVDK